MMSTNKNNLSREEQLLRDKINEADFAYQEADWNAIESKVENITVFQQSCPDFVFEIENQS